MATLKKKIKNILQNVSGYEIQRVEGNSFTFANRKHGKHAWFSYYAQLRSIFEDFKIDLAIDVGANEGQFAKVLRSFYHGEILSFEPVMSVFERLAMAAAGDSHWHVSNFALGSTTSSQTIHVSDQSVFSSLLKTNDQCADFFGTRAVSTREEQVSVRRLDEVLDDLIPGVAQRRIFLKLDTQGYDLEVFKGLANRLTPVLGLQSEVSFVPLYDDMPHWTESIVTYEREGFSVVGLYPVTRHSFRMIECDCLLVRES